MTIDHYSSATAMLLALEKKEISSVELTEMPIARISEQDEKLNAIPVKTFDRARQEAIAADDALAKGTRAPLLGLPMTLKESTQVEGLPQSAGILDFKDYQPASDGLVAAKFADEGFCLLGKTNIPVALGDWHSGIESNALQSR
jgi:amidase